MNETRPDRGRVCLDEGTFLLNWAGCADCGSLQEPVATEMKKEDEENLVALEAETEFQESVLFKHECANCQHVVAPHFYSFTVTSLQQEFLMECPLCGKGADTKFFHVSSQETNLETHKETKQAKTIDLVSLSERIAVLQVLPDINDQQKEEEWK